MNKRQLARQIVKSVRNATDTKNAIESVESFLSVLEPKDREKFASWGYPEDKPTNEECLE